MTRAKSIAVVAFIIACGIGVFLWRRSANAPTAPAAAAKAQQTEPKESKPKPERPKSERGAGGQPPELQVTYEDDPVGALRLEGQVVDAEERPVAGAVVQSRRTRAAA